MNRKFLVIVFLSLFSLIIYAQKNQIKLGFLSSGGSNFGLAYERSVFKQFSLLAQGGFVTDIIFNEQNVTEFLVGSGFYLEGRYYLQKEKKLMQGWHAGINFMFQDTELESDVGTDYLKRTGLGLGTGYQWIFSNSISLDTIMGLGFSTNSTNIENLEDGPFFTMGLHLGYNF